MAKWGSPGSGDGQFSNPLDISIDAEGYIYVLDASNGRIQKFTSDGSFVSKWDIGSTNDQSMAADLFGNIYTTGNFTVRKFNSNGTFIKEWGSEGSGDGQFEGAYGIAIDLFGNVYASDYFNHRIQKFTSDGVFIAKWGTHGTGDGQFDGPQGMAFDQLGNLYVADRQNHRIQVFINRYEGTLGTEITIKGSYFGAKKGTVWIGGLGLKVIDWKIDSVRCQLSRSLAPGIYDVTIRPTGESPIVYKNGFAVKPPEINSVDPIEGSTNDQVAIHGRFFGAKKGSVYLEYGDGGKIKRKTCKIINWEMDPKIGKSEIVFIVPKGLALGVYLLRVMNFVGDDTVNFAIVP